MDFYVQCVKYVSFSSGGTNGYLYVGALNALKQYMGNRYQEWTSSLLGISGCSSGSLAALALALNVNINKIDFGMDDMVSSANFRDVTNTFGAINSNIIKQIVSQILDLGGLSPSATLAHLHRLTGLECTFVCTSLTTRQRVYVNYKSHSDTTVMDAICASCCIPGVFQPVIIAGEFMVDGNLLESIPARYPIMETLFIIVKGGEISNPFVLNTTSYITALLEIVTRYADQITLIPTHRRIFLVNSSLPFNPLMSTQEKVEIRHSGYTQTMGQLLFGTHVTIPRLLTTCVFIYYNTIIFNDPNDEEIPSVKGVFPSGEYAGT